MKSQLEQLTNVGPGVAKRLESININTIQEFKRRDPFDIYREIKEKSEPNLTIHFLSALVGASLGVPWFLIHKEVKKNYLEKEEARQHGS